MTNKLEELKQVIQEANPEIMELKFGCRVLCKDKTRVIYSDKSKKQWWLCLENNYQERFKKYLVKTDEGNFGLGDGEYADYEGVEEIIGRDIQLVDVLIALKEKWLKGAGFSLEIKQRDLIRIWNLKGTLDNQSEETINLLHSILCVNTK